MNKSKPQLVNEVESLRGQLRATRIGRQRPPSRNRRRARRRGGLGAVSIPTTVQRINAQEGTLIIHGCERLADVNATGVTAVQFYPGVTGAPRLDVYAGIFELYRVKRAALQYRTGVGTTVNGIMYVAADYDGNDYPSTVQGVAALNPIVTGPVWKDMTLNLPVTRMNKGNWMYTTANPSSVTHPDLGSCCYMLAATNSSQIPGELWLDYEIEFSSPTLYGQVAAQTTRSYVMPYEWNSITHVVTPKGLETERAFTTNQNGSGQGTITAWTGPGIADSSVGNYVRAFASLSGMDPTQLYRFAYQLINSTGNVTTASALAATTGEIRYLTDYTATAGATYGAHSQSFLAQPDSSGNLDFSWDTSTDAIVDHNGVFVAAMATLGAAKSLGHFYGFNEIH